jgi:hypothetical protein
MNYVTKNTEKVAVASKEDAKALMRALSEHDCRDNVGRQDLVGKTATGEFFVLFEDVAIGMITEEDALTVLRWMIELGLDEVTIKRSHD